MTRSAPKARIGSERIMNKTTILFFTMNLFPFFQFKTCNPTQFSLRPLKTSESGHHQLKIPADSNRRYSTGQRLQQKSPTQTKQFNQSSPHFQAKKQPA
jgi:hypothetical protein